MACQRVYGANCRPQFQTNRSSVFPLIFELHVFEIELAYLISAQSTDCVQELLTTRYCNENVIVIKSKQAYSLHQTTCWHHYTSLGPCRLQSVSAELQDCTTNMAGVVCQQGGRVGAQAQFRINWGSTFREKLNCSFFTGEAGQFGKAVANLKIGLFFLP